MDFENLKQVTNIEYVGPHQIQTTSMPSVNFSARIESQVATSILYSMNVLSVKVRAACPKINGDFCLSPAGNPVGSVALPAGQVL